MSDDIDLDFNGVIEEADWSMLEPHHKRGALFIISSDLDLNTVGRAVASDKVDSVKKWLTNNQMYRPNEEEVEKWKEQPHTKLARFLIVQPYVVIQLIEKRLQ